VGELPARLYKYQPANARTLENLRVRGVWFSHPSAFNDPFDCAVDVRFKNSFDQTDLDRVLEYVSPQVEFAPEVKAELLTDGRPNERFQAVLEGAVARTPLAAEVERLRENIGVACFSARVDQLLMWAHYGDGHRGLALEFDTSHDPFQKAIPVAYQDGFPEVNPIDILDDRSTGQDVVEAMLCTKHSSWEYEQEWRVLRGTAGTEFRCAREALTGVYLGAAMSPGMKDIVGKLLHGSAVQLYEMTRDPEGFAVRATAVTYTPFDEAESGDEAP